MLQEESYYNIHFLWGAPSWNFTASGSSILAVYPKLSWSKKPTIDQSKYGDRRNSVNSVIQELCRSISKALHVCLGFLALPHRLVTLRLIRLKDDQRTWRKFWQQFASPMLLLFQFSCPDSKLQIRKLQKNLFQCQIIFFEGSLSSCLIQKKKYPPDSSQRFLVSDDKAMDFCTVVVPTLPFRVKDKISGFTLLLANH